MKRNIYYIPNYKGLTKTEKDTIRKYPGHENIIELFEHGIITKSELFSAIDILYK